MRRTILLLWSLLGILVLIAIKDMVLGTMNVLRPLTSHDESCNDWLCSGRKINLSSQAYKLYKCTSVDQHFSETT